MTINICLMDQKLKNLVSYISDTTSTISSHFQDHHFHHKTEKKLVISRLDNKVVGNICSLGHTINRLTHQLSFF